MKQYRDEYEGQREFYSRVGIDPTLSHSIDGVDKGNLYENKIAIKDIFEVLSQAIKYASRIRIRGELLPSNLILNDLNREIAYIFNSGDLLADIEKVYFGAASKNNELYETSAKYDLVDYSTSQGLQQLLVYVNNENFTKYHIDKNNIVGLSQEFYKHTQNKDKFIKGINAEIRMPTILADRIYAYSRADNLDFDEIMDCLNPGLLQREQGAFYTPPPYVNEMHDMLNEAISQVPRGLDYVIIDRCAGTGNLFEGLSDEVLAHCVMSTIEFNEYAILNYKFGDKCLVVIPNTDALAYDIIPAEHEEQVITNDFVREKVIDPNCVIILMENPPFSEAGSGASQRTGRKENLWKKSFVFTQMRKEHSRAVLNELSNLFIWSGFKYYLKKREDSFILYSPTKYWRNQNLVNKKFAGGFLCNRAHFHAKQASAIGCIWWRNIEDEDSESLNLTPFDIVGDKTLPAVDKTGEPVGDIILKKAKTMLSESYDRRQFKNDEKDGLICEKDGSEYKYDSKILSVQSPLYNKNIIAYIQADSFTIDRKTVKIVRGALYNGHGFYVRSDNFLEKLPIFVAASYPYDRWYKTDVYSKSSDGQEKHLMDEEFLMRCLIYTCLTWKNKCRSLTCRNGRFYRNELCFDSKDTLAWKALENLILCVSALDEIENNLLKYWDDVMFEAKKTSEYNAAINQNPDARFGLWQVMDEMNLKIDSGRKNKKGKPVLIYKYTALNTEIKKLDYSLKNYYSKYIIPDLFKYELIK